MQKKSLLLLFTSFVSFCSQEELQFGRPYCIQIEQQNRYKSPGTQRFRSTGLTDHSCLFRVYLEGYYFIGKVIDTSKSSGKDKKKSTKKYKKQRVPLANDSFVGLLPFDSFVNPQLYSVLCDAKDDDIARRLVYFNTDRRHLPVAGTYSRSYVKAETLHAMQNCIAQSIQVNESFIISLSAFFQKWPRGLLDIFFGIKIAETFLPPALCLNADYKKILHHIEAMRTANDYAVGFVSTKDGGYEGETIGHGMIIVAHKKNNQVDFTCMDSVNSDTYWFEISVERFKTMIKNPNFLKDAIVRYVCATKSAAVAQAEIQELGLQDYPLYVNYYKGWSLRHLLTFQKAKFLILLMISLYVSQGVMY